ncbi:hypothetical protein [Pseudomonas syringae]|uniref:ANTAR domain-containing protein n=1 Tax=Pseudomonas syringae TaxID=317 RepID=A0A085V4C1_PSESX|nr:hypothetical protein [Pseudomonas syringae]KFE50284.1 hypothetical protein IV02_17810 [Pseudomonas syringae]
MNAKHRSGSDVKATTTPATLEPTPARRLMAIRIVGTALFDYQVKKTADARIRLETVMTMAHQLGDLTVSDAAIVAQLLAKPMNSGARA